MTDAETRVSKGKARAVYEPEAEDEDGGENEAAPLIGASSKSKSRSKSRASGRVGYRAVDRDFGGNGDVEALTSSRRRRSHSRARTDTNSETSPPRQRSLKRTLLTVFLMSFLLTFIFIIFLLGLMHTYRARLISLSPSDILDPDSNALRIAGPIRAGVVDVRPGGEVRVRVEVGGGVGVDVVSVAGFGREEGVGFGEGLWRWGGRRGVLAMKEVTVDVDEIRVYSAVTTSDYFIASLSIPTLTLPLIDPSSPDPDASLTPLSCTLIARLTTNASEVLAVLKQSWAAGGVDLRVDVGSVRVRGGKGAGETGWRSLVDVVKKDVSVGRMVKIPRLPGLPPAGHNASLPSVSDLVELQSFAITSDDGHLSVRGEAALVNPFPGEFNMSVPTLPFIVSLPNDTDSDRSLTRMDAVPVASVQTLPFTFTHPNTTLNLIGTSLPLPQSSTPLLSTFLSTYLLAQPPRILLSSPELFPGFVVPALFPAPRERPRILREVRLEDMRIDVGRAGVVRASGTVWARVVLPEGVRVGMRAERIWPDVVVFDGEVPEEGEDEDEVVQRGEDDQVPPPPLPSPLPARAFARIRPEDWLPAHSTPIPDDDDASSTTTSPTGTQFLVSATLVSVPLQVLPGREREFSDFVGKVIFGRRGAVAGVRGVAGVGVVVDGLSVGGGEGDQGGDGGSVMELMGLPFQGNFRVGKKVL